MGGRGKEGELSLVEERGRGESGWGVWDWTGGRGGGRMEGRWKESRGGLGEMEEDRGGDARKLSW